MQTAETSPEATPVAEQSTQSTLLTGSEAPVQETKPSLKETIIRGTEQAPVEAIPEWIKDQLPERYHMDPNIAKYKDMESFIDGHLSLSKKIGEKFEQPGPDADKEAWDKWYDRIGRPTTASEYKFEPTEGTDIPRDDLNAIKSAFHDLGLNQKQFDGIMKFYTEGMQAQAEATAAERAKQEINNQAETIRVLQKEWGNEYDANLKIANQTLNKFGIADSLVALGLGNDPIAVKLGYELAQKTGETMLNAHEASPTSFAETIKSLKESDAYKKVTHPDHQVVTRRIMELYKRQYN